MHWLPQATALPRVQFQPDPAGVEQGAPSSPSHARAAPRPGPGPSVPGWRSAAAPRPRAARARRTWPRTRSRPAADTRLPACSCACLLVRAPACLLMHPACPRARPASPTANKGLCVLAGCSDPTRPAVGVTPHEWVTAPVDAHGGPDSGDSFYKEQIELCGPSSQQ